MMKRIAAGEWRCARAISPGSSTCTAAIRVFVVAHWPFNPGLNGQWATTNTLIAAVQVLLPGEIARAHRHSPAAIRFIMSGNGAYTAVEGEKVVMREGDLVLTPSWLWHDHGNETRETV